MSPTHRGPCHSNFERSEFEEFSGGSPRGERNGSLIGRTNLSDLGASEYFIKASSGEPCGVTIADGDVCLAAAIPDSPQLPRARCRPGVSVRR